MEEFTAVVTVSFAGNNIEAKNKEDYIQKCEVTIKDRDKKLCFRKTYSQIDRWNRRFYTNQ